MTLSSQNSNKNNTEPSHEFKSFEIKNEEKYSLYPAESKNIVTSVPYHESDVTKTIKESIERNSIIENSNLDLNFKEVFDLARVVINEIPGVIDKTEKTINKVVSFGKESLDNINNFTSSIKDKSKNSS